MARLRPGIVHYIGALAAVAGATLITRYSEPWLWPSVSLLFFPAILIPAMYGGYGPALFATVLATAALAFFFIPPTDSVNIGADDAIRLAAFALVAMATAGLSSARRRAEQAQRQSLAGLRAALDTLQKVSRWPLVIGSDTTASIQSVLRHSAEAVGAVSVTGVWESEDEPWVYVAVSGPESQSFTRYAPTEARPPVDAAEPAASASFTTEHLTGRVFFGGLSSPRPNLLPAVDVIAREIGNSLDHLYVAGRMRELALRDDRLRLSRDLHDGVLQSLTGIRLELQDVAEDCTDDPETYKRLLAAERALALEQRELRRFIDGLKPTGAVPEPAGDLASTLGDSAARLAIEWKTPITVRVMPADLRVAPHVEDSVRLMVHEAVVNALKHGHPSRVAVSIEVLDSRLAVTVTDDGRGFAFRGRLDHDALLRSDAAPASLRDRVSALAGHMAIDSSPHGARVEISVPLQQL